MGEAVFFRNLTTKGLTAVNSGERYFEGYLTVQVKDKQGEVTIVDELMKVLPVWIDRGAPISDTHSNRIIGKGINYAKTVYKDNDGEEYPAIKVTGKIHKNYELDNDIWTKIKSGEYKGLSFGGATKSDREPMRMKDGSIAYSLKDLEHYEVAVCRDPAVPLALITEINTLAKAAVDGEDLGGGRMMIKCTRFGCYVDKDNKEAGLKVPEASREAQVYEDTSKDQPIELENKGKIPKHQKDESEAVLRHAEGDNKTGVKDTVVNTTEGVTNSRKLSRDQAEANKGEDWSNADGDRTSYYTQDVDEGGTGKHKQKKDGYGGEQNNAGEVGWSGSGSPYPKKAAVITNIYSRLKSLKFKTEKNEENFKRSVKPNTFNNEENFKRSVKPNTFNNEENFKQSVKPSAHPSEGTKETLSKLKALKLLTQGYSDEFKEDGENWEQQSHGKKRKRKKKADSDEVVPGHYDDPKDIKYKKRKKAERESGGYCPSCGKPSKDDKEHDVSGNTLEKHPRGTPKNPRRSSLGDKVVLQDIDGNIDGSDDRMHSPQKIYNEGYKRGGPEGIKQPDGSHKIIPRFEDILDRKYGKNRKKADSDEAEPQKKTREEELLERISKPQEKPSKDVLDRLEDADMRETYGKNRKKADDDEEEEEEVTPGKKIGKKPKETEYTKGPKVSADQKRVESVGRTVRHKPTSGKGLESYYGTKRGAKEGLDEIAHLLGTSKPEKKTKKKKKKAVITNVLSRLKSMDLLVKRGEFTYSERTTFKKKDLNLGETEWTEPRDTANDRRDSKLTDTEKRASPSGGKVPSSRKDDDDHDGDQASRKPHHNDDDSSGFHYHSQQRPKRTYVRSPNLGHNKPPATPEEEQREKDEVAITSEGMGKNRIPHSRVERKPTRGNTNTASPLGHKYIDDVLNLKRQNPDKDIGAVRGIQDLQTHADKRTISRENASKWKSWLESRKDALDPKAGKHGGTIQDEGGRDKKGRLKPSKLSGYGFLFGGGKYDATDSYSGGQSHGEQSTNIRDDRRGDRSSETSMLVSEAEEYNKRLRSGGLTNPEKFRSGYQPLDDQSKKLRSTQYHHDPVDDPTKRGREGEFGGIHASGGEDQPQQIKHIEYDKKMPPKNPTPKTGKAPKIKSLESLEALLLTLKGNKKGTTKKQPVNSKTGKRPDGSIPWNSPLRDEEGNIKGELSNIKNVEEETPKQREYDKQRRYARNPGGKNKPKEGTSSEAVQTGQSTNAGVVVDHSGTGKGATEERESARVASILDTKAEARKKREAETGKKCGCEACRARKRAEADDGT